ncbi:MAG: hypothetical protein KME26_26900 [Oscillatoria princeps RMCB-10]|nr:hypothetical protein [Oscillatoria princeps RMCB-10]
MSNYLIPEKWWSGRCRLGPSAVLSFGSRNALTVLTSQLYSYGKIYEKKVFIT